MINIKKTKEWMERNRFGSDKQKTQKRDMPSLDGKWFNFDVGSHTIRILPAGPNENENYIPGDLFAFPVFSHYNLPGLKGSVRCVEQTYPEKNIACPVCDAIADLKEWINKAGLDPEEEKRLSYYTKKPSFKAYCNAISRDNKATMRVTSQGKEIDIPVIYIAGLPSNSFLTIMKEIQSHPEDYEEMTDPQVGYDITVEREGKSFTDTRYSTKFRPRSRVLSDDPDVVQALLENMFNIGKIFPCPEKAAFDKIVAAGAEIRKLIGMANTVPEGVEDDHKGSTDSGDIVSMFSANHPDCFGNHLPGTKKCLVCLSEDECKPVTAASGKSLEERKKVHGIEQPTA